MLSRSTAELKSAFSSKLTEAQYEQQIPRLQRNIYAFLLLSGAYPAEQVEAYVEHWQALLHEIERLAAGKAPSAYLEAYRKEVLNLSPFWLHSGDHHSNR